MKGLLQPTQGPIARGTIRTSAVLGLRLAVQAGTLLLVARMLGPQAPATLQPQATAQP